MDSDTEVIKARIDDCNLISSHCKKHDLVIQAGGHLGLYPERLATIFKQVITFEADKDNFDAWPEHAANITKYNAILGKSAGYAGLQKIEGHSGRGYVKKDGHIPMMNIDSLAVDECDLIYLDIEGYEMQALYGAVETIEKFRPVICIESKKLIRDRGYGELKDPKVFFKKQGYEMIAKYHLDCVYFPI